jgi:hypothetical protein
VREIHTLLNSEAQKVGLSFANDKNQILLPKDWETPQAGFLPQGVKVLSNTFEDITKQGIEVVGSPVGSPGFCRWYIKKTISDYLRKQNL